mgnify:CR=1 FL=1
MTVKSLRGRRRYIMFAVTEDVDRRGLEGILYGLAQIRIIHCDEGMAVIRCTPGDREEVISRIVLRYPGSGSLKTSGTLKTLREIYGPFGKNQRPEKP